MAASSSTTGSSATLLNWREQRGQRLIIGIQAMDVGESGQLRGWLGLGLSGSTVRTSPPPVWRAWLRHNNVVRCFHTRSHTNPNVVQTPSERQCRKRTIGLFHLFFFRPILPSIRVRMYILTRGYGLLRRSHPHIVRRNAMNELPGPTNAWCWHGSDGGRAPTAHLLHQTRQLASPPKQKPRPFLAGNLRH